MFLHGVCRSRVFEFRVSGFWVSGLAVSEGWGLGGFWVPGSRV